MKAQWLTIWAPCCLISKNLHTGLLTFEQQQQIGKMLKSKKVISRYVCYVNISCVYIVSPPTIPAIPHLSSEKQPVLKSYNQPWMMEFCCGPAWWGSCSISFHQKLKEHVRAAKFIKNKNDQWNHAGEMGP